MYMCGKGVQYIPIRHVLYSFNLFIFPNIVNFINHYRAFLRTTPSKVVQHPVIISEDPASKDKHPLLGGRRSHFCESMQKTVLNNFYSKMLHRPYITAY